MPGPGSRSLDRDESDSLTPFWYCHFVASGLDEEFSAARFSGRGIVPVLLDRIPELQQAFVVRVTVLHDEPRESARVAKGEPYPIGAP